MAEVSLCAHGTGKLSFSIAYQNFVAIIHLINAVISTTAIKLSQLSSFRFTIYFAVN